MNQAVAWWWRYFSRPFWLVLLGWLLVVLVALGMLLASSQHAVQRIEPLRLHLGVLNLVEQYRLVLHNSVPDEQLNYVRQGMLTLADSPLLDKQVRQQLQQPENAQGYVLDHALQQVQQRENLLLNQLLQQLDRDSQLERDGALMVSLLLGVFLSALLAFMYRRLMQPLRNLRLLLQRLGRERNIPLIPLDGIAPFLRPLFRNFNQLVRRLDELERQQADYQAELELKVQASAQSLLEYQQSLARSEKLAALGELSASLAHELRNPLTGIELALRNLYAELQDESQRQRVALVLEALQQVNAELNQVLSRSRHSPEAPQSLDLTVLVQRLIQLMRYQLSEHIQLHHNLEHAVYCCLPAVRLRQVLANLLLNAAQSFPQGAGRIWLSVELRHKLVYVRVCDDGPGFNDTVLQQAGKPFVSDKEQGTGLGLAMVKRFCNEQGGRLQLSNLVTGGACVELFLPQEKHG